NNAQTNLAFGAHHHWMPKILNLRSYLCRCKSPVMLDTRFPYFHLKNRKQEFSCQNRMIGCPTVLLTCTTLRSGHVEKIISPEASPNTAMGNR
ncbi:hypothetical protein Ancab_022172, partial [Ancistrocladus abbreviatus]